MAEPEVGDIERLRRKLAAAKSLLSRYANEVYAARHSGFESYRAAVEKQNAQQKVFDAARTAYRKVSPR